MAFSHGKNTKIYINEYDLTEFFDNASPAMNADTAEVSCFGEDSKAYVPGMKDATLSLDGLYDGTADKVDEIISDAFATGSNLISVYPAADVLGSAGYAMNAINTAHTVTSTIDNASRINVAAQSDGTSAERVLSLHAMDEEDTSWTGASIDCTESSPGGGSAYIHVTGATGEVEVKVQHSSDDFSSDTEDLVSFTAVTGATSERKTFTGTVKRYIRGVATIGAGEDITFQLGFHRE
jgi:hypothetical protein